MELIEEKNFSELKSILNEMNPVDLAGLFEIVEKKDIVILFRLLSKELAADTFTYIGTDRQQELIQAISESELKEVIDELFMDDTVDIIEEMPANVVNKILRNTDAGTRKIINELLNYPKDSAGSIMTTEYVPLKKEMTVADAFDHIRRVGLDKETIYTCYVIENRRLVGIVTVKELLTNAYESKIEDIMETNIISVFTHDDKEDVAKMFNKYDFLAIPVVDNEQRLVGIVTVDDAMDVMQEENEEDIEVMAAITPTDKPYMKTSVFETWKKRIPWLMLLMVSATFTGKIIQHFEDALQGYVILTAFIPMLMDTGGNAGGQASVTIIRGLSLNEIDYKDIFKIIWKEARVALLCGVSLAVANFIKMMIIDQVSIPVAMVVCITLVAAVFAAKVIGCMLPIGAKKLGFDPAVMASPFITTIVDAISLMVYFNVAAIILHI